MGCPFLSASQVRWQKWGGRCPFHQMLWGWNRALAPPSHSGLSRGRYRIPQLGEVTSSVSWRTSQEGWGRPDTGHGGVIWSDSPGEHPSITWWTWTWLFPTHLRSPPGHTARETRVPVRRGGQRNPPRGIARNTQNRKQLNTHCTSHGEQSHATQQWHAWATVTWPTRMHLRNNVERKPSERNTYATRQLQKMLKWHN